MGYEKRMQQQIVLTIYFKNDDRELVAKAIRDIFPDESPPALTSRTRNLRRGTRRLMNDSFNYRGH